jgi:ABC-2 type transport system permease protein
VAAIYELFFAFELFLSGRIAPLALFPEWARTLADWLPFRWTFGFPIEALIGQLSVAGLIGGLAMQAFWILLGLGLVLLVWRRAVQRYTAVGG